MNPAISLCLALCLAQTSAPKSERPRHPLAPSLPLLTKEEMARYEAVIDRFIQYDIGKLPKAEGKKALEEFKRLPAESIFALIDGFNRAANDEHSCPAVIIANKIASILRSTDDLQLITYAKDNIGAGVKARRHAGSVQTLQVLCILRKGHLQNQKLALGSTQKPLPKVTTPPVAPASALALMSPFELAKAAKKEEGPLLKSIIAEAKKRKLVDVLGVVASRPESEAKELGQTALEQTLAEQTPEQLKKLLKHEQAEVRAAAASAIGKRKLRLGGELIDALSDSSSAVQQAARRALGQLSQGRDFGPEVDASESDRAEAIRRWREWWSNAK